MWLTRPSSDRHQDHASSEPGNIGLTRLLALGFCRLSSEELGDEREVTGTPSRASTTELGISGLLCHTGRWMVQVAAKGRDIVLGHTLARPVSHLRSQPHAFPIFYYSSYPHLTRDILPPPRASFCCRLSWLDSRAQSTRHVSATDKSLMQSPLR